MTIFNKSGVGKGPRPRPGVRERARPERSYCLVCFSRVPWARVQGGSVRQAWECVGSAPRQPCLKGRDGLQLFDSYAPFLLLPSSAMLQRSRAGKHTR
jgi:hypothetical protein